MDPIIKCKSCIHSFMHIWESIQQLKAPHSVQCRVNTIMDTKPNIHCTIITYPIAQEPISNKGFNDFLDMTSKIQTKICRWLIYKLRFMMYKTFVLISILTSLQLKVKLQSVGQNCFFYFVLWCNFNIYVPLKFDDVLNFSDIIEPNNIHSIPAWF